MTRDLGGALDEPIRDLTFQAGKLPIIIMGIAIERVLVAGYGVMGPGILRTFVEGGFTCSVKTLDENEPVKFLQDLYAEGILASQPGAASTIGAGATWPR